MNPRRLSIQAERDLRNLLEYLADRNPAAADRLSRRLEHAINSLAANPELGRERPDLGPDLRSLPVENTYIIIYRPAESGITVARIIHGSRDLPTLFP